ncbi:MAG: hypothetical protein AAF689_12190 [Pseudomonadota bacterium]
MGQAAEAAVSTVSNEAELSDFLNAQSAEVSGELAYRAGLRALGDATRFDALSDATAIYALAACRAILTAGVMARMPRDTAVRSAAAEAAKGTAPVRAHHRTFLQDGQAASYAMVRVISALEAVYAQDAAAAAELASHAMAHDRYAYQDCDLDPAELPSTVIDMPAADPALRDQLTGGDVWAFWRAWHEQALKGSPLPWSLQRDIALLPKDAWEAGAAVIAARIGRIFARMELIARIDALEKRMEAHPETDDASDDDVAEDHASAGFGALRLIREPVADLLAQTQSPQPQPFLIQKATARLVTILAASNKWLGRAADGDIKDMVRMIGKGGGVATATWIDGQAPQIRAVVRAAEDWRQRLPA